MKLIVHLYLFRLVRIIIVVEGLHSMGNCSRAQHEIFDASVIQKWKDYEAFSHRLQGTARSQGIRNGKPRESIKRFKQNRECALAIEPHNREPTLLSCSLANPRYIAIVNLSKSDPGNAVLQKFTPLSSDSETLTFMDAIFYSTSRHFAIGRSSRLRQIVQNPSFKVTNVAKEIQNGQELIRIDHIYNYVLPASQDRHVQARGSLWLDPSRSWCIRRYKSSDQTTTGAERDSETEVEVVCKTIDDPSGFPILKSTTEDVRIINFKNHQKLEETRTTDYELEVNDRVPDNEFTLTAFGLPEPGGEEPMKRPTPFYIWILAAAGVFAVLALGFRYLVRRGRLKDAA
jgi:hypothetical protein